MCEVFSSAQVPSPAGALDAGPAASRAKAPGPDPRGVAAADGGLTPEKNDVLTRVGLA